MNKTLCFPFAATLLAFALAGCTGDDAPPAQPAQPALPDVARGEYLARSVLGCGVCHTPYNPDGTLIQSSWLAGNSALADFVPDDDSMGRVSAPDLTSSATGLGNWSDAQIKAAIAKGVKPNGSPLLSLMPSYMYALLTDADLDSLVAYLRTLPASDAVIEPSQVLGFDITATPVLERSAIPDHNLDATSADFASAENGKYLASIACTSCHTNQDESGHAIPTAVLQGNRTFYTAAFGYPQIGSGSAVEFPPVTRSANLTPDATGIASMSTDSLQAIFETGMRADGSSTCIMAFYAGTVFSTMEVQDKVDIANYLLNLTPVANDTTEAGSVPACAPIFN